MKPYGTMLRIAFDYYSDNYSPQSIETKLFHALREIRETQRRIEADFPRNEYVPFDDPEYRYVYVSASFGKIFVEKLREAQFPLGESNYGPMYSAIWGLVECADESEISLRIALATERDPDKVALYDQIKQELQSLNRGIEGLKDFPSGPPESKYFIKYGVREKPPLYVF